MCTPQASTTNTFLFLGLSILTNDVISVTCIPTGAECRAATPPLLISLNHHLLCGVPLQATLYQIVLTTSHKWDVGTQRQSCDAFSGSGKHIKPLGTATFGTQDQSNHTI